MNCYYLPHRFHYSKHYSIGIHQWYLYSEFDQVHWHQNIQSVDYFDALVSLVAVAAGVVLLHLQQLHVPVVVDVAGDAQTHSDELLHESLKEEAAEQHDGGSAAVDEEHLPNVMGYCDDVAEYAVVAVEIDAAAVVEMANAAAAVMVAVGDDAAVAGDDVAVDADGDDHGAKVMMIVDDDDDVPCY